MAHSDASRTPQDPTSTPASTTARSSDDDGRPTPQRAWFPPSLEDFEITPEAAMYAGRR